MRQRRPHRSRPMPPVGWRSLKPSTTAPGAMRVPSLGRRRQTRGSGSSVCLWWPTAAGVRRRRSSPSARRAPRRACRSGRVMPSRHGSGRGRSCGSSNCSRNAHGSTSHRPPRAGRGAQRASGDPRADATRGRGTDAGRSRLYQPGDRRHARDQRQDCERPRISHPAQARHIEPCRSRRNRTPSLATARPTPVSMFDGSGLGDGGATQARPATFPTPGGSNASALRTARPWLPRSGARRHARCDRVVVQRLLLRNMLTRRSEQALEPALGARGDSARSGGRSSRGATHEHSRRSRHNTRPHSQGKPAWPRAFRSAHLGSNQGKVPTITVHDLRLAKSARGFP